jgi:hypothetical protein
MSQETIIDENYRMPEPVRVGEETGSLTRVFQQLVFTVDHKKLGLMYIGAGLLFFVIAGFLAALLRGEGPAGAATAATAVGAKNAAPAHAPSAHVALPEPQSVEVAAPAARRTPRILLLFESATTSVENPATVVTARPSGASKNADVPAAESP